MGEQSTINLLSSINGSLNKIVELMLPQNKNSAKADADKVKNLSQGGLSSALSTKPAAAGAPVEGLNITVSEIVSTLTGLPEQVLAIAKLADGTVDQFKTVMIGIASTFTDKEMLAVSNASSEKAAELLNAISKLNSLPAAIQGMSGVNENDVKALQTFMKSVVSTFAPDTFKDFDQDSIKKTSDLLAALSKLNTVPDAMKKISRVKTSDVRNFKKLVIELVSVFNDKEFKSIDSDTAKSGADLIVALSKLEKLPDMLKSASKIKERDVKSFAKAIGHIMEMIGGVLRKTKVSKDDIQLAQNTADTIARLATSIKMLAKMTLIAPLALIGVLAMIPVWIMFGAVAMLIGKMAVPINRGLHVLNRVDRFLYKMMKTALLGVAVAGSVVLLGLVMRKNMETIMYGLAGLMITFLAIGVIAILGGLVGLLVKSTNLFTKQIILFTLGLIAIAGLIVLLGMLVKATWKEALIGLAAMTVMLAYTLVLGLAAYLIGRLGLEMAQLKTMAGLMFLTLGLMAMTILTVLLGTYVEDHIEEALVGLAATLTILGEVLLVAYAAKYVSKNSKSAVKDLLICEGVILGAQAIIYTTIKLGEFLWEYIQTEDQIPEKLGILFIATTAVIMGAWGVTKIANRASKDIKKGAIALLLAEGVILASALVVTVMIGVSKLLQNSGVEMQAIMLTLMVMGAIVAGAGAVAVVAGKFGSQIQKGALVMAIIELLILGMVGIVYAIVKTSEAANKLSNGWLDVLACVGFMAGLIVVFTAFAVGIGLMTANPYVAAALTLGLTMLAVLSLVIAAVTGVTFLTIALSEKLEKSGKTVKQLGEFMHSITHELFTYENFDPGMSVIQAAKLSMKYLALIPALLGITLVIGVVSDMAKKFGGLSEMRGEDYYISPYYGMNGNEPVFGEPVNVPKIAENIVNAVTIFSNKLFDGFESVDLTRLVAVGITMQSLIEPVSKFAQMVSGFKEGGNENELKPVFISENGDIRYGATVNVVTVATSIAGAIAAFATTLYGNGDEPPQWMYLMRKRKYRKRLENAMGTFAVIIEPVEQFVNLLLSYQSAGPNMIKKAAFDDNGNFIDNGVPAVNVITVATQIAGSIKSFAEILFGDDADWLKVFKREKKRDAMTAAIGSLASLITPISSFVDALAMLEPDGNDIYAVSMDNNGNLKRRRLDILNTAVAIASAISTFVNTLFGEDTAEAWKSMMSMTSKGGLASLGTDESETPFSTLGLVLEPIGNFVNAIMAIGGESDGNNISIPIYDQNGNQVGVRVVNLYDTARIIASAVSVFLRTLFSIENQNVWKSLIYGYDSKGNLGEIQTTDIKDSIGVFAAVVDPIVKFVEVISRFGGTAEDFKIFDGEKSRSINLVEIATAIAGAISSFMTQLKPAFNEIGIDPEQKGRITDFANAVGDILESFAKIGETKKEQIDLADTVITKYFDIITNIKAKMEEGLPQKTEVVKLKETMTEVNGLFNAFNDTKFDELNYKQGLEEFKYVAQEIVNVADILSRSGSLMSEGAVLFSVIDTYLNKIKNVHDFIISTKGDITVALIASGVEGIELMANSYAGLPDFSDLTKLGFITDYVNAIVLIRTTLFTNRFGSDAVAMTDLMTSITSSVVRLTEIKEGDIKAVSKAYTGMLEKMITLSSRGNRKSLSDTSDAFNDLTTSMVKFDEKLVKKSDERKKKLEELVEQVEHLNEKLDTTTDSMKKLVDYLEDIEEDKLDKVINAGQEMNSPRSSSGSGGSNRSVEGGSGGSGEGNAPAVNNLSKSDITNAIRDAFDGMRLNSGTLGTSSTLMSAPAMTKPEDIANIISTAINSLKNLDFEFTTNGTFRE